MAEYCLSSANHPHVFICTILVGLNISLVVYGTYMSELLRPWIMQWLPERFGTEPATLIMETVITTFFSADCRRVFTKGFVQHKPQ